MQISAAGTYFAWQSLKSKASGRKVREMEMSLESKVVGASDMFYNKT